MAKKIKGSKKLDRCKRNGQNARYINERRHEKSHVRRIKAHLLRYGMTGPTPAHVTDKVAYKAFENYKIAAGIY